MLREVCNTSPTGTHYSLQPPLSRTFAPFVRNAFILFANWPHLRFRPASMLLSLKHARLVPVGGTCTGARFLLLESLSPDLCRAASTSFRFNAKQKTWASLAQAAHGPDLPFTVVLHAMHLYLMVVSVFVSIFTCLFACLWISCLSSSLQHTLPEGRAAKAVPTTLGLNSCWLMGFKAKWSTR